MTSAFPQQFPSGDIALEADFLHEPKIQTQTQLFELSEHNTAAGRPLHHILTIIPQHTGSTFNRLKTTSLAQESFSLINTIKRFQDKCFIAFNEALYTTITNPLPWSGFHNYQEQRVWKAYHRQHSVKFKTWFLFFVAVSPSHHQRLTTDGAISTAISRSSKSTHRRHVTSVINKESCCKQIVSNSPSRGVPWILASFFFFLQTLEERGALGESM